MGIKYGIVFSCLLFLVSCYLPPVYGATDSGVLSATSPGSPSASIRQKLEELKKEIASKAAELKKEVSKKIENKAWAGIVKEKRDNQLILISNNIERTVIVNEYTVYQTKTKAAGALKDLLVGDYMIALGDVDDKNRLTAKKIVKKVRPKAVPNQLVWGQIQSNLAGQLVVKQKDNQKMTVDLLGKTIYRLGNEEASLVDVKINQFLVAVGDKGQDGSFEARFIYLIPSAGFIMPEKKVASNSATTSSKLRWS